ncbi:S9 family peptidase [Streptomyces sp. NPDC088400]|uniref:S9 family peptidase n=1 Tax=Streptomyces sp. NPDC088400 TaxID=3365861 RepID=UPI003817E32F
MALRETISVKEFFGPPPRAKTTLSPDGKKIAYLALWKNRMNVWIESVDAPDDARCVTTEDRGVVSYHWTRDPRWLLYCRDQGGDENVHLYRVDLENPDAAAVDLTPCPGVRTMGLDLPAGRPGKVITQLNLRDRAQFDLVELDIATGDLVTLAQNPGGNGGNGGNVGEFAGTMHDDLIDGVRWAVDQGYADPDRVAIMGGSYGGYASLVGVTFTPDVFAAAVDIVGISDLANFMRSQSDFVKPMLAYNWFTYVGDPADPEQEADMLARSPISRVDRIRTPLMVVHGANDARVALAESEQLVEALRARGVPVEYTVMEDEGHAIENPENVIALYAAAERFLAEHLGFEAHKA